MPACYLLDSNILIAAIKGEPRSLLNRLARMAPERLCLSAVVMGELLTGAEKSRDPDRTKADLADVVRNFQTLAFTTDDAEAYGRLRADLESRGEVIGPLDMLIAAQALNRGMVLVSANLKEFQRVRGLSCDNWLA